MTGGNLAGVAFRVGQIAFAELAPNARSREESWNPFRLEVPGVLGRLGCAEFGPDAKDWWAKLSKLCRCAGVGLKKGLLSLFWLGVGGPLPKCPDIAAGVTKGRSIGEANPRLAESCVAPVILETEDAGVSSLVIANSEGTLPELLCFRRLLCGPGKSVGEACLDKLRGVWEFEEIPFVPLGAANELGVS